MWSIRRKKLIQMRLDLGDLAAKAGVAADVLSEMERGDRAASPAVIAAVAQACGVDAALLLDQDVAAASPRAVTPPRRSARRR